MQWRRQHRSLSNSIDRPTTRRPVRTEWARQNRPMRPSSWPVHGVRKGRDRRSWRPPTRISRRPRHPRQYAQQRIGRRNSRNRPEYSQGRRTGPRRSEIFVFLPYRIVGRLRGRPRPQPMRIHSPLSRHDPRILGSSTRCLEARETESDCPRARRAKDLSKRPQNGRLFHRWPPAKPPVRL